MANFARSLKSPSYLSPRLRPSMPGRTLSSSSDVSVTSNSSPRSDDFGEIAGSGRNTPTGHLRGGEWNRESDDSPFGWNQARDDNDAIPVVAPRSRRSRPIAIELPKVKRLNSSAPVYTPPEPLSARGDLPGGYFPLHEDPNARIHRPHPFYHDKRKGQHATSRLHADTVPMLVDRTISQPILDLNMSQSHTPVSSYLPSGFHESPMPMGKYYPSNYEQRNSSQSTLRPPTSGSLGTSVKSDSQVPRLFNDSSQRHSQESEVRRRLQQYQRDMMAQASMAATELLGGSASADKKVPVGATLHNLAIPELRLTASATNKPIAPRLVPLGSPGPVTPMELEGLGGDYLAARR